MYQVNLGNKILYYPANDDYTIFDTELNEEVGLAGEFTFKVPLTNPLYSSLEREQLITIIKDGIEIWRGEIKDTAQDGMKNLEIYCAEDLTWLTDEYLTPASITTETYAQRFQAAIAAYNQNRSADRQFQVGYLTARQPSDLCNWITEYEWSILDDLRNCICGDDGYIRVRRVTLGSTVTRYIDIIKLSDYGSQARQPIEFGYNLLDYVKESDSSNLTNVLIPYGAELETELYEGYAARLQGTPIQDDASIAVYGRHAKQRIFDDVSDLTTLNALAQAYLTRYSQPQLTLEVTAVDLGDIENIDSFKIGDSIRILAKPYAIDQWLYLTQIKRDLQNVAKNSITLSGYVRTGRTLTSAMQSTTEAIKNLPSKASILDAAKKNALELLNGENGGYVTFEVNENDQITELRIANNMDFTQATKAWRWNINGLAYMSREDPSDEWTVGVAATMDGGIVADYLTSGTITGLSITGNSISGGTITGTAISGGTINGAHITSQGSGHSVDIQGGSLTVTNDDNHFLQLDQGSAHLALGGYHFAAYNSRVYYGDYESIYIGKAASDAGAGSDKRIKKNIETLDKKLSKSIIRNARPVSYLYNDKAGMHNEHGIRYGLIAQELRKVLDENNVGDAELEYIRHDGYHTIEYKELIAHLINTVQDLYNEIEILKGEEDG